MNREPRDATSENRTFDEIAVGENASIARMLRKEDVELFAVVSGDANPALLDPAYAETDLFLKVIAHGMWGGALLSAVLGMKLPGPGTSPAGCRRSRRTSPPGAWSPRISATARASAPCATGGASTPPWASPRPTG